MQHDDLTPETVASALSALDPNVSRDEWWRIAASIKSLLGDQGFDIFDNWSSAGHGYNARSCADTWKSTKDGGGVNIGTLIYKAQQVGWKFDEDAPRLSAADVAKRREERELDRKAAEAKTRKDQGEAAKLANLIRDKAQAGGDGHEYLQSKGVKAHGLLLGDWPLFKKDSYEIWRNLPGSLLVPIMDATNGKVISLQGFVFDDQGEISKRYLKNGRKRGGCHIIGTPPTDGQPMAFCEGYATGATIHELTGWCVVVCFDAGNLSPVAAAMRELYQQAPFIICADNDPWSKHGDITNPGVHFANKAADESRAFVIVPEFADLTGEPSDFNDLARREGDAVAHAQLVNNPITARAASAVTIEVPGSAVEAPANDNPVVNVDWYSPLPDVGSKGKPKSTIENLEEILDRLGVTVRYNVIGKTQEIMIPGERYLVDNAQGAALARIKSQCARFDMGSGDLADFLLYLSDQRPFNPVLSWLESKPWDGKSRFPELLATVKLRDGFDAELWPLLARRWMISAMAAAAMPSGFWSKGVLVFQGEQSLGKTAWFRALLPPELRNLLKVDATINPDNKDTIISAASHWLVELGELDGTLRKADIARLKGFISQDFDQFRRPYAKAEEKFPRRTVFFASVNPAQFLADDTGNVRWWTIPVDFINSAHGIDMQQLWAEVYSWFLAGERWWLEAHEEQRLEAVNAAHTKIEPIEERLQTRLDWDAHRADWTWRTATEILITVGMDQPTQADANKASAIMRKLNGKQHKRSNGRGLLLCPPRLNSFDKGDYSRPF